MLADLAEMSRARLNDNVRVLALVDWNAKAKLPGNATETFPAGSFLYRPIGGGQRQLVGTAEELDFDDPTVLADAIGPGLHPLSRPIATGWCCGITAARSAAATAATSRTAPARATR